MVVPATFQLNLIWIDQGTNGEKKEDARTKANSALDALTGGMDFAAVARQYSDDSSAASNGGQISGSFHAEDLVEPLAQAIEPLAAGETSPIVEYDGGYYIIQVRDRTEERSALDALTGGMDFAAVARQYSDDSSAASNGGQISGSFHAEDLVEPLAQAIEPLAAGETSPIVEYDGGYYIIQVRDRTEERQQTFEEVADTIKAHLQAQQHEQLEADMQNTLLERANLVIYDKTLRRLVKETEQGAAS